MQRVIAIGDVHGCYEEFETLLDRLDLQTGDRVIQVGDLVNRGPNSHHVIRIARQRGVEAILGNHELRFINAYKSRITKSLLGDDLRTLKQFSNADWKYLLSLPAWIELPEYRTVCVHAGFLPGKAWYEQGVDIVTRVQMIDDRGQIRKRADFPMLPFWADLWATNHTTQPFVIYGHTPRKHLYPRDGSLGIDTGCVYGGALTAYILPQKTLLQVPAFNRYQESRHV
jgi:hypothetical protein